MEIFRKYLESMDHPDHRNRVEEILSWVIKEFPDLKPTIKWNTPMFSVHDTYIIGFSIAKDHLSVAPEEVAIMRYDNQIKIAGYSATKNLFRIQWTQEVDYDLLKKIIEFNLQDKAEATHFWRK